LWYVCKGAVVAVVVDVVVVVINVVG